MKELNMNEILKEWRVNPTKELESDLYDQAIKLGYSIYFNEGISEFNLDNSEIESSVGITLAKAIKLYDPENEKKVKFTTYLGTAIKNSLLLIIRKKNRPNIYKIQEYSLEDIVVDNQDSNKSMDLNCFVGDEKDPFYKLKEEELIKELCKKSIQGFDPKNCKSHIKRYNDYYTTLKLSLAGYTDGEIMKILGFKSKTSVAKIFIYLRKGATRMEEYKDIQGRRIKRPYRRR